MKFGLFNLLIVVVLGGCGGGGSDSVLPPLATATNHACIMNNDTMADIDFIVPAANTHGCIVSNEQAKDGLYSLKFTVNANDCYDKDCSTDRSRYEIYDNVNTSTNGKTVQYRTHLYIPTQERFRPRGNNIMFVSQINVRNNEGFYHTLAYLEIDQTNSLMIRTHQGFTWNIKNKQFVTASIFDRWISVDYEIKSSTTQGYLRIWVDGTLFVDENIPTMSTTNDYINLKLGIYNAFKSQAIEAFSRQTLFYDGIKREYK